MQSRSGAPLGTNLGDALVFYTSLSRIFALQGTDARRRHRFVAPAGWQIVGLQFEESVLTGTHVERVPASGEGSIEQIGGWIGTDVKSVHFTLRAGEEQSYGSDVGNEHDPWILGATELILIAEQGHKEHGLGASLVFYTSHGRVLKLAGVTGARSQRFAAPAGKQVCGLHFEGSILSMVQTCSTTGSHQNISWSDVS
jgi:hypothetical protein